MSTPYHRPFTLWCTLQNNTVPAGVVRFACPIGAVTPTAAGGAITARILALEEFRLTELWVVTGTAQPGDGDLIIRLDTVSGSSGSIPIIIPAGGAAGVYKSFQNQQTANLYMTVNRGDSFFLELDNQVSGSASAALREISAR